jgi:hypothetical protein
MKLSYAVRIAARIGLLVSLKSQQGWPARVMVALVGEEVKLNGPAVIGVRVPYSSGGRAIAISTGGKTFVGSWKER